MQFYGAKKRIYLDHASATPLRKEVRKAMEPYWSEAFGNAGGIHAEGVRAKGAIEEARATLAKLLHVRVNGIVFTGSGTESNNLAILGTLYARRENGIPYEEMEVISTPIEHPSVLQVLAHAGTLGVKVKYVGVDEDGLIDMHELEEMITERTVLITCAYANSEIGAVQNIARISRIARAAEKKFDTELSMHVDAAQAPLWLSCEIDKLGCDMLSLDAGKCCGPKGLGVLAFRHGVTLKPVSFGGLQEGGLRPATENAALIVGGVLALSIAQQHHEERAIQVRKKRDAFIEALLEITGTVLNGSQTERLANNVNISIPGIDSEFAVIKLDEEGIAASTKSACGGAKGEGSHVVRVLTKDEKRATSTIRFTLGEETKQSDLDATVKTLRRHVEKMLPFSR